MDALIQQIQERTEAKIDFKGQKLAEFITQQIIISSGVLAFALGLVAQDLRVCFGVFGTGILICAAAVLPPWPMYRTRPVKWLSPIEEKKKD